MLLADRDDVVRGLIYRNYNIFVVNNGHDFCIYSHKGNKT
jgi:hypothetical protein